MQARSTSDVEIPSAVRELVARIRAAGHEAVLVGGCVRGLLAGHPVHDFDVATSAEPEALLELFPRAVPIGLRHGTLMVPTPAGPVDVTRHRGPDLETDLARRDFTVNAIAFDPETGRILDPTGGRADLAAGRLRAVGRATDRLTEDPLRALRAARFCATLGLAPDAELEAAMAEIARQPEALASLAGERVREELQRLLLAANPEAGLSLLRRTGLEAALVADVREDAATVVAALPRELEVRLAGWLRGARAAALLPRMRAGRVRSRAIERLLALHPIDETSSADSPAGLRRLLARAGAERVAAAVALRRAELAAAGTPGGLSPELASQARERLDRLVDALDAVGREGTLALERAQLAVDGRQVMDWLGCGPGPEVGAALRHLTERVIEEPACNTASGLRAELERWQTAAG